MSVKIIERDSSSALQSAINHFLKQIDNSNIIDIKYSGRSKYSAYSSEYYSAMIILKD